MATFPNAAPPQGALFDNVPTATMADVPQTLTVHLTPATRICQDRTGRWLAIDVLMQYGAPVPLALALKRVQIGRTVFVRREDAGAVLVAANAGVTDGEHANG